MIKETVINNNTYRIKELNAIETLALQDQIRFDTFEESKHTYETLLEKVEVQVVDKWLPVKSVSGYLPVGIEKDMKTIKALVKFCLTYLNEVFQESNELNNEQE